MATLGHRATIRASGAPIPFVAAGMTDTGGDGLIFQLTDPARHILDPDTAIVVEVDTGGGFVAAPAEDYRVLPLAGMVAFKVARPGATVRMTGAAVPTLAFIGARECSVSIQNEIKDNTALNFNDGNRTKDYGLGDLTGDVSLLDDLFSDLDPGAGAEKVATWIKNKAAKLIEYAPFPGEVYRAWVLLDGADAATAVDDYNSASISFSLAPRKMAGRNEWASYGMITT
jgi:hypothetical protein